MLLYSLVAVPSVSVTCTVMGNDDGLLRTSSGWAGPAPSLKLYDGWPKSTVIANNNNNLLFYIVNINVSGENFAILHNQILF